MESERIVKNNEIEIEEVNVYTDDCGTTRKACVTDCIGGSALITPIWKSSRKYYLQRKIWKIKNIQMRIFLQRKGWNWNRKNNCLWKKHRGYIQSGTK